MLEDSQQRRSIKSRWRKVAMAAKILSKFFRSIMESSSITLWKGTAQKWDCSPCAAGHPQEQGP